MKIVGLATCNVPRHITMSKSTLEPALSIRYRRLPIHCFGETGNPGGHPDSNCASCRRLVRSARQDDHERTLLLMPKRDIQDSRFLPLGGRMSRIVWDDPFFILYSNQVVRDFHFDLNEEWNMKNVRPILFNVSVKLTTHEHPCYGLPTCILHLSPPNTSGPASCVLSLFVLIKNRCFAYGVHHPTAREGHLGRRQRDAEVLLSKGRTMDTVANRANSTLLI
jgi:hypothetical protein